jgi:hypothetical protein
VEGSDDYDECIEWVNAIEAEWDFVSVIVCSGSEMAEGCVGWTAEEMQLLYETISETILGDLIDDGGLTFVRTESEEYAGLYTPQVNDDGTKAGEIRLSDKAWMAPPMMGIQDTFDLFPNSANFQGTIAHEFTHAAIWFHPEIRDSFKEARNNFNFIENLAMNLFVGVWYNWGYYDEFKGQPELYEQLVSDEYLALIVSGMAYDAWFGNR